MPSHKDTADYETYGLKESLHTDCLCWRAGL